MNSEQKDKQAPPVLSLSKGGQTPDEFGIPDGSLTVGETKLRFAGRAAPHSLSSTKQHPCGLIPLESLRWTKRNPAPLAWEIKQEKIDQQMLALTEIVMRGQMDTPYYGLKTRAEILWAIADTWKQYTGEPIVKTYPSWFVAIKEMRRLWREGLA
jgi:hypothetical protein